MSEPGRPKRTPRELRDHPFTLRQLQYAVAVHTEDGFGRAASTCGVSQPSLSAQVAKLEDLLGVQLFERHARGVLLTAAGERLLPSIERVLLAASDLADRAREAADPDRVVLRIGVIPTVAPYLLPAVVERLRSSHPDVRVHWVEKMTARVEDGLQDGWLDAGVIADPPSRAGMEHVELHADPFVLVLPPGDPREGPLEPDDLGGEELMLLEDGHCLRDHALAFCLQGGAPESPYRGTSLGTLVQMVSGGLGATVLPTSAVTVETARADVRVVPFVEPAPWRTIRLVWRARSPLASRMPELAEDFRAAFADLARARDTDG